MLALEVLGGAIVLIGLALVLGRRLPTFDDEPDDAPDPGLPEGRLLRSDDVPRLRFRVGLRGYRMTDVDAALEAARLALAEWESGHAPRPPQQPELDEQPPQTEERPLSELEELHSPSPADEPS